MEIEILQALLQAVQLATATVQRLDGFNRRTLDGLAARVYFYYAWLHECTGQLMSIQRCAGPVLPEACAVLLPASPNGTHACLAQPGAAHWRW